MQGGRCPACLQALPPAGCGHGAVSVKSPLPATVEPGPLGPHLPGLVERLPVWLSPCVLVLGAGSLACRVSGLEKTFLSQFLAWHWFEHRSRVTEEVFPFVLGVS